MKKHPVRRAILATAATVSGVVLLLTLKPGSDTDAQAQGAGVGAVAPSGAAGAPSAQGGAAAGTETYTGSVADTQYGPVQVQITVAGGKITAANAVQAPKGGRSDQITADSVPKLNQEAVAASGNAEIDAVSGATYTSAGYKKSLQAALDQAGG